MNNFIPLVFAIIPALFLVRYFYLKDINKPEPIKLIIKIFIIGFLSIIPVVFIELIISAIIQPLISNILIYFLLFMYIWTY